MSDNSVLDAVPGLAENKTIIATDGREEKNENFNSL